MSIAGPVRVLVATAAVVSLAVSLPAQRYYGRDHHVYHAPAQTKHPASTASRAHATSTSTASNAAHNASATSGSNSATHGNVLAPKPEVVLPANPGERQPQ